MAYSLQDDEQRPQDERQQLSQNPLGAAIRANATGLGAPATGAAQAPTPESPSGFVSFDRYFNDNGQTAHNQADQIAQQVGQQAQDATSALNTAQADYKRQVDAAKAKGPYGTYGGPTDFGQTEDLNPIQQKLDDASSALGNTKDAAGLKTFFDAQHNTNGSYTEGMGRFDAALANQAGGNQFAALRKQYAGLDQSLANAYQQANQYSGDAANYFNGQPPPVASQPTSNNGPKEPMSQEDRNDANRHVRQAEVSEDPNDSNYDATRENSRRHQRY